MAKYKSEQITFSNWITYLTGLDSRIVQADADSVTIDGKVNLSFPMYQSNPDRRYMKIIVNGVEHQGETGAWFAGYTQPYVTTFIGDNVIIIRVTPSNIEAGTRGHEFVYITDGIGNYYAGIAFADRTEFNIYGTSLYDVTEGTVAYKIGAVISGISASAGTIAYSNYCPIVNGSNILFGFAKELLSCSTIAQRSVIALPNGNNYYALGTNTLIKIE